VKLRVTASERAEEARKDSGKSKFKIPGDRADAKEKLQNDESNFCQGLVDSSRKNKKNK